ncbi:MAG: endonuclease III [Acidobacteria bacterium]|nr:endonuclease III [Acidobacteriota bacterium]
MSDAERAAEVLTRLRELHPEARVELDHDNPLQLLIATILSAQSTDRRVNLVTPELFKKYPDAAALAGADQSELEEDLRSTGFFRQKAKNVIACCERIVEEHGGSVPEDMDDLTALPGVGRKTANVVRAVAFGLPGITVDTHCKRLSQRLGFTEQNDPVKIEHEVGSLFPPTVWADVSRLFVWHGRYTCKARTPLCAECNLQDLCPWFRDQVD